MKAVLDHVGIAVSDLQASLAFFKDVLGLHVEMSEEIASQKVRAHFLSTGQSTLEMLEATAPDSPIAKYLEKRGPGMHHVALRVDDIDAALAHLKSRGIRLIDEQARPGAEGALVAFIHPSAAHGVLVELKQPAPKVELFRTVGRRTLGDLELHHAGGRVLRASMAAPCSAWCREHCGRSACRRMTPTGSRSACGRSSSATARRR